MTKKPDPGIEDRPERGNWQELAKYVLTQGERLQLQFEGHVAYAPRELTL